MVRSATKSPVERKASGDKSLRPTSPVHVHVDNETPVHFHVQTNNSKKNVSTNNTNKARSGAVPKAHKQRINAQSSSRRTSKSRSVTRSKDVAERSRSASPRGLRSEPLTYPKSPRVSWDAPTGSPADASVLRTTDDPYEKGAIRKNMNNYVEKIDTLMDEMGKLKNHMHLATSLRAMERNEDDLDGARGSPTLENELRNMGTDANSMDSENERLRSTLDQVTVEAHDNKVDRDRMCMERERLKKKLIEVEIDGKAATRQIYELRDVIRQLQTENTSNSAISQRLSDTRGDLLDKLSEFEKTNRSLREMLKEQHNHEMDSNRQREQVEVLLLKISEYESRCQRLSLEVLEKDRSINELQAHVQGQLSENLQTSNCVKSLESVKAHLQKQLKMREGDVNRLNVQVRVLENTVAELNEKLAELDVYRKRMQEEAEEKEQLKNACRIYKEKSEKAEETIAQQQAQLEERDAQLGVLEGQLGKMKIQLEELEKFSTGMQEENETLQKQIEDLETTYKNAQMQAERTAQDLMAQIQAKVEAINSLNEENNKLMNDVQALRTSVEQYEVLVEEYKCEMQRTRHEAECTVAQLEHEQLHNSQIQKESQLELQQLKDRLQMRLHELEPLPAMLETTELKLQNNQCRLSAYEYRNHENTNLIAELSGKLDRQTECLMLTSEKGKVAQDHNRTLVGEVENLERKLTDSEGRNRELTLVLSQRDQALAAANSRVDDATRENTCLTRQLETTLADLRRQSDQFRDKTATKERAAQSRLCELEQQMSTFKSDNIRLARERQELEHGAKSRLCDLNGRLEQSYSTNRSMQSYVHFLKQSYGNVFGDVFADGTCGPCTPCNPCTAAPKHC